MYSDTVRMYININININIDINIYIYVHTRPYIYICICKYIYIYMDRICSHPFDRPCPCDGVLLSGDWAAILYLITPRTTIIYTATPLQ